MICEFVIGELIFILLEIKFLHQGIIVSRIYVQKSFVQIQNSR
jgi:hypothetical protein